MNYTHTCPWPECEIEVSMEIFACRTHWYRLPPSIRSDIWRTYRAGDHAGHVTAMDAALEWIKDNGERV